MKSKPAMIHRLASLHLAYGEYGMGQAQREYDNREPHYDDSLSRAKDEASEKLDYDPLVTALQAEGWEIKVDKDHGLDIEATRSGFEVTHYMFLGVSALGKTLDLEISGTYSSGSDADEDGRNSYDSTQIEGILSDSDDGRQIWQGNVEDADDLKRAVLTAIKAYLGPLSHLIVEGWEPAVTTNSRLLRAAREAVTNSGGRWENDLDGTFIKAMKGRGPDELVVCVYIPEKEYLAVGGVWPAGSAKATVVRPEAVESALPRLVQQLREQMASHST